MSEATVLGAESAKETAVRAKVKSALVQWVAGNIAIFNNALAHLAPGLAGQYLADVMAIPQVVAWEKAEIEQATAALIDLSFWGGDSLGKVINDLLVTKLHIQLSTAQQAAATAAGGNGVSLTADEVVALHNTPKAALRAFLKLP